MTALYNFIKRGRNKIPTRRFVPREIQGDFVSKEVLSFPPNSRGNWTPSYEDP